VVEGGDTSVAAASPLKFQRRKRKEGSQNCNLLESELQSIGVRTAIYWSQNCNLLESELQSIKKVPLR